MRPSATQRRCSSGRTISVVSDLSRRLRSRPPARRRAWTRPVRDAPRRGDTRQPAPTRSASMRRSSVRRATVDVPDVASAWAHFAQLRSWRISAHRSPQPAHRDVRHLARPTSPDPRRFPDHLRDCRRSCSPSVPPAASYGGSTDEDDRQRGKWTRAFNGPRGPRRDGPRGPRTPRFGAAHDGAARRRPDAQPVGTRPRGSRGDRGAEVLRDVRPSRSTAQPARLARDGAPDDGDRLAPCRRAQP